MWPQLFEIASHIKHPYTVALIGCLLAAYVIGTERKRKRTGLGWLLGCGVIILSALPTLASTYLHARRIYHVRIIVLNPDNQPLGEAEVSSSVGGELKKGHYNWEFNVIPQAEPSDGRITFFASVKSGFLAGNSTIVLKKDYFPEVIVQLKPLPSAMVRGVVEDDSGRSVSGATVSISGYSDFDISNNMGNFSLPAHAANGQMVSVRAQKGDLLAEIMVPAGTTTVLRMRKK